MERRKKETFMVLADKTGTAKSKETRYDAFTLQKAYSDSIVSAYSKWSLSATA